MKITLTICLLLYAVSSFSQNGDWIWVNGDSTLNSRGAYGTQGVTTSANQPPSRYLTTSWKDNNGDFWFFGGFAWLSDLWKYNVANNKWTWIKGDTTNLNNGVYSTLGVPSGNNKPGGRFAGTSWTDNNGSLWLFGGYAFPASGGNYGYANDLWKYDISINQWTWISGDSTINNYGLYGTKGTPSPTNKPGGRRDAMKWIDKAGNLWLFGGYGYDASGSLLVLNDLWKYNITNNEWTWVNGDSTGNQSSVYGMLGTAALGNKPGGRQTAASWTDNNGDFWLFGGNFGYHNDLWKYSVTTNEWTWVNGDNTNGPIGQYGTQGVASSANKPGGRQGLISWIDNSNNLWLLGGEGRNALGNYVWFDDLWRYDIASNLWTWMKGDSTGNNNGVYGTIGIATAANNPGSRIATTGWTDNNGSLWMFGGYGYPASGSPGLSTSMNDLWKFDLGIVTPQPTAQYSASIQIICINDSVTFTDQSGNTPTSWNWTFTGGTPDTSSLQNPVITYTSAGTYPVKLVVSNASGTDSLTKAAYINVGNPRVAGVITGPDSICSGSTIQLSDTGSMGRIQWQSSSNGISFVNVPGDTSSINNIIGLSQTTYYRVYTSGSCGADSTAVLKVYVNAIPVPVVNTSDTIICSSDSAIICESVHFTSYHWNTNDTTSCTAAKTAGDYWLTVTDANNCSAVSSHQKIFVHPVPSVSIITRGDTLTSFGAVGYQWILNDSPISGATGALYAASQAGSYTVQITDTNGCSATSSPITITGINDLQQDERVLLYPNPAPTGHVQLEVSNELTGSHLQLYDDKGRIVFQSEISDLKSTLNLNLAKGIYWLQISSGNANIVRKLVRL